MWNFIAWSFFFRIFAADLYKIHDMKKFWVCMMTMLVLMTAASCTSRHNPLATSTDSFNDADGFNHADSIISDVGDTRDHKRALEVIDSLEKTGELSLPKVIFYRTISYNMLGQRRNSLMLYSKLAGINVETLTTKADFESYIYSYNNYVRVLCDIKRYDRALREANAADHKLRRVGYDTFLDHHDIAQIIGECQLYLGQTALAAQSFQKSLKGVHKRLAKNHDPLDYRECQKTMNAIVRCYMETKRYDEVRPWIAVQDSLYEIAGKHPRRDSVFMDEMKADINYSKALLALAQGLTADAERAFSEYQTTRQAKQPGSIINSNEYLILAHRYDEAASNYELLDLYLKESGYKADFENFGRFMIPKYRANLLAGKRDSALRVASIISDYYDSAQVRQRRIDADLLTTFYDTEGKERQIAEQRAELSQQRMWTVVIVMAVFFIFAIIYTMQRRRAYRKLNVTNRELVRANKRAEESSRMKTKFIQQISHEVRTPLNVLSGFTQVLATPNIDISSEELQLISQKIVENSNRITTLVDKMLDLSLVNSQADIECHDTLTAAELAMLATEESGIRRAEHLEFELQISPEAESMNIVTNRKSAVKALVMLLDNAIKFTHPLAFKDHQVHQQKAHVTLSVSCTQEQAVFVVEDTGIGIPPEQAENIFTEFVQLDEYSDGTGIGLSIARSFARHMNGNVILDTTYTGGARFFMTLCDIN